MPLHPFQFTVIVIELVIAEVEPVIEAKTSKLVEVPASA